MHQSESSASAEGAARARIAQESVLGPCRGVKREERQRMARGGQRAARYAAAPNTRARGAPTAPLEWRTSATGSSSVTGGAG